MCSEVSPTPQNFGLGHATAIPDAATATATRRFSRRAASSSRRRRRPARRAAAPPPTSPASWPGDIALIQRGSCTFGEKVPNAAGRGRLRRDHLQRGQPGPHRRVRTAVSWTRTAIRSSRRSRSRSRRSTSAPASTTSTRRRHGAPVVNHRRQGDRRPEPRRLQRHRRLQGRRPEQRPRRRRAPRRDLRRRDARQRVGLGDDPRHRPADAESHRATSCGSSGSAARSSACSGRQYYVNNLSSTDARPRSVSDLDADVTATPNYVVGVLDPAGVDFFGRDPVTPTFPSIVERPRQVARDSGDRLPRLDREEPPSCSRRSEPTRSCSSRPGSRPAAC